MARQLKLNKGLSSALKKKNWTPLIKWLYNLTNTRTGTHRNERFVFVNTWRDFGGQRTHWYMHNMKQLSTLSTVNSSVEPGIRWTIPRSSAIDVAVYTYLFSCCLSGLSTEYPTISKLQEWACQFGIKLSWQPSTSNGAAPASSARVTCNTTTQRSSKQWHV